MTKKIISEFEFLSKFNTEGKAVRFFEVARWPEGRFCPSCGSVDTYAHKSRRYYYHCRDCRKQFSCKTGSVMQASPLPVRTWLYAMYKVSVARKGISSFQMSKELGVTKKTAWHMLHRIREACGNHGLILSGIVEVDETFTDGKESNNRSNKKLRAGRRTISKQPILGFRQRGRKTLPYSQPIGRG